MTFDPNSADPSRGDIVVDLRQISKEFPTHERITRVLTEIDLTIRPGEFVALLGPSGCGKTTLLSILGTLLRPTRGTYRFEGRDLTNLSDPLLSRLRNERIGFVFQLFHLLPRVSAVDNVLLPVLYSGNYPHDARDRAKDLLRTVGLGDRLEFTPESLSGGQQQRVAIARALMNRPAVLLADEPTGNLDRASSDDILGLFVELHRIGTTIVLVTHDADVAARADGVIRLQDGRIVEDTRREMRTSV